MNVDLTMTLTEKRIFKFILVYCYFIHIVISWKTQLSCLGADQEPWHVDYSDNEATSKSIQDWLYAHQHDCSNPYRRFDYSVVPDIGMGSVLQYMTNAFIWSFSHGRIFRPTGTFKFSDVDPRNCSLGVSTLDCYLKPISPCGYESKLNPLDVDSTHNIPNIQEYLGNLTVRHGNVCTLGRLFRKPIQWVHSQFLVYLIRPRYDIAEEVQKRVEIVFAKKRLNPDHSSVIGVHYRDGNTYDFGRRVLNISTYMQYIDMRAADLAARGKPVVTVFICSHLQEHNIKSSEYMNAMFPRPFEFVILPHVVVPHVPYKMELDDALGNRTIRDAAPLKQMFIEYLSDVEILSQSDVYIGVTSNVYTLVAGKRISRQFGLGNDTCYIDSRKEVRDMPLICEDDPKSHDIWKMYFEHLMSQPKDADPGGGYETGVPFYEYSNGSLKPNPD